MSTNQKNNNSYIKVFVLVCLCLQNSSHALLTRYSKNTLKEEWSEYEVVMVSELLKLIVATAFMVYDSSETDAQGVGWYKLLWLIWNGKKMMFVVIGYVASNLLSYAALQRIDASVYTVLGQLKLFSTAAISVFYLNTFVSATKYRALLLLAMGCILVTSPNFRPPPVDCDISAAANLESLEKDEHKKSFVDFFLGVGATLIMVLISGMASVFLEKTLKGSDTKITIWERNVQLAFYSWLVVTILVFYNYMDYLLDVAEVPLSTTSTTSTDGGVGVTVDVSGIGTGKIPLTQAPAPFHGWTWLTVLIAMVQAAGGILVAATLKYADSIIRNFATAGSITLSTIVGFFYLGGVVDLTVGIGIICTVVAMFNYTMDTTLPPDALPIVVVKPNGSITDTTIDQQKNGLLPTIREAETGCGAVGSSSNISSSADGMQNVTKLNK